MKKFLIVLIIPLLTACWPFNTRPDVPIPQDRAVLIDREILKQCQPIPNISTTEDIGVKYVELIGVYGICSNRQRASIEVIKKLGNIKE